jgi:hypothetical protein
VPVIQDIAALLDSSIATRCPRYPIITSTPQCLPTFRAPPRSSLSILATICRRHHLPISHFPGTSPIPHRQALSAPRQAPVRLAFSSPSVMPCQRIISSTWERSWTCLSLILRNSYLIISSKLAGVVGVPSCTGDRLPSSPLGIASTLWFLLER